MEWRYRVEKKGKEWKDEVYEVGTGFREKNTRIHGKGRDQEGKVKREIRKESVRLEKRRF